MRRRYMSQYGLTNDCILKSFMLRLDTATNGDTFMLVSKPDGTGGATILADDPVTVDNFELIYSSRDVDFNLVPTVAGQSVVLATDVKPSANGFYIYKFSYKNVSFIINIVIMTSYNPKFDVLYREFGLQVTEQLRTFGSCTGNNYIRLVFDE